MRRFMIALMALFCSFCVLSFVACTKPEEYFVVTFDSDGGTDVVSQTVKSGGLVLEPETPSKTGYVFLGWFVEDTKWVFEENVVTSDITLKARWVIDNEIIANRVVAMIEEIGSVTLNSGEKIKAARSAYDALTEEQKNLVSNYSILIQAEEDYENLLIQNVISLIDLIGTVTLDSYDAIESARSSYEMLASTQKALVTNYSDLIDAEERYNTLLEEKEISQ